MLTWGLQLNLGGFGSLDASSKALIFAALMLRTLLKSEGIIASVPLNSHSFLSEILLLTLKWLPGDVRACPCFRRPGCTVFNPAHLLWTAHTAQQQYPHPNISVTFGHPLAPAWKQHNCERSNLRLLELRIKYSAWNQALELVIKAFTLKAKPSLESPSLADSNGFSAAVVGLVFFWHCQDHL